MSAQPEIARFARANVRAALWALWALRKARSVLAERGIDAGADLPAPPAGLPAAAERGVRALLTRRNASCLERSLVMQRWHAAHGDPRELIVGVTAPGEDFRAHAWLEGEDPCHDGEPYTELTRRPAPAG